MPIKIKKFDIDGSVDKPEDGYMILGFDDAEKLVQKNHRGVTSYVIPAIDTGSFINLEVEYLTVGSRASGEFSGLYSISQGTENVASGKTSITRGIYSRSNGEMSYASGYNVSASGYLSYIWGNGGTGLVNKMESDGINSFVHQYSTVIQGGTLSDYSAILGGHDHSIGSSSDNAIIIGGYENEIQSTTTGSTIIGGYSNIIQTGSQNSIYLGRINLNSSPYDNTTYVRMISLDTDAPFPISFTSDGLIWYDSTVPDIKARIGGQTYSLKAPDPSNFVTVNTSQTIDGAKIINNNLYIGTGTTTQNLIYVNSYNTISSFAQFSGNWGSTQSWGIGPSRSNVADLTVKIGVVDNSTTGNWSSSLNANLVIDGGIGIGLRGGNPAYPSDRLQIGQYTSTAISNPDAISLGGTYSNTAGTHFKLKLYDNNVDVFGLGVSSTRMDIGVPVGNSIAFYKGGVQTMIIDGSGNVGIGIDPGSYKLNINGNVYAGNITSSYAISSYQYTANGGSISAPNGDISCGFAMNVGTTLTTQGLITSNGGVTVNGIFKASGTVKVVKSPRTYSVDSSYSSHNYWYPYVISIPSNTTDRIVYIRIWKGDSIPGLKLYGIGISLDGTSNTEMFSDREMGNPFGIDQVYYDYTVFVPSGYSSIYVSCYFNNNGVSFNIETSVWLLGSIT